MSYKDTFGGRVYEARKNKKSSQESLANLLGVKKQAVSNWENNKNHPDSDKLSALCGALGVEINWLLTGVTQLTDSITSSTRMGEVTIYNLKEITDIEAAKVDGKTRPSTLPYFEASDKSFAVIIEDSSMAPEFIVGDVVIIDPEIKPVPGDRVCALVQDMNNVVFRIYKSSGLKLLDDNKHSKFTLVPINDHWSPINISDNGSLLGVMVEHKKPRRIS